MFQAGGADVVIVSYDFRQGRGAQTEPRRFCGVCLRCSNDVGLQARNAAADADDTDAAGKKKKRKAPKEGNAVPARKAARRTDAGMTQEELDTVSEEIAREEEREREADRRRILEIIASLANVTERGTGRDPESNRAMGGLGGGKRGTTACFGRT